MPGVRRILLRERIEIMNHLKYFLMAFIILCPDCPVSAQKQARVSQGARQDDGTRRGFYYNCGFGYAFDIPKGFTGEGAPDGYPQHGVRIRLSGRPESYVWIDGSFSEIDWRTLEDAAKSYQDRLTKRGDDVSVVEKNTTRLGRLRALRLTYSYRAEGAQDRVIEEVILALRRSRGEAEIIYTVGLRTPQTNYQAGRRMLENVLRTWQLKPLPCA